MIRCEVGERRKRPEGGQTVLESPLACLASRAKEVLYFRIRAFISVRIRDEEIRICCSDKARHQRLVGRSVSERLPAFSWGSRRVYKTHRPEDGHDRSV